MGCLGVWEQETKPDPNIECPSFRSTLVKQRPLGASSIATTERPSLAIGCLCADANEQTKKKILEKSKEID
jgi:hypothetical protein